MRFAACTMWKAETLEKGEKIHAAFYSWKQPGLMPLNKTFNMIKLKRNKISFVKNIIF
jgi:hypothetical protein